MTVNTAWTNPTTLDKAVGAIVPSADYNELQSDVNRLGGSDGNQKTGQFTTIPFDLTDAATIAIDWNDGNKQRVTLVGNRTLTFANPIKGTVYTIELTQDATGSRTVTWPTIKWQAGTAPVLTTTPAKKDLVCLFYDGTDYLGTFALAF